MHGLVNVMNSRPIVSFKYQLIKYSVGFGKELFIRFTAIAFRKLPSIYVFSYVPFGFEGRMWDLIVSVPDHCLSFYFAYQNIVHYNYEYGISK